MRKRTARVLALVVLALSAVAYILLDGLAWPARLFTAFLLVPLPAMLIAQARMMDRVPEELSRHDVYSSSALSIMGLAVMAMLTARFSDFSRLELRLITPSIETLILASGLTTLAGLALMALGRALRLPDSALIEFLLPRTTREKIGFTGLSFTAGLGEEIVYRSFLIAALLQVSGSVLVAVFVSVAAFALAHAYQGVLGVVRVALLGLVLTAPFLLTGSVYPSMIAHAALDILAGIVLADRLRTPED